MVPAGTLVDLAVWRHIWDTKVCFVIFCDFVRGWKKGCFRLQFWLLFFLLVWRMTLQCSPAPNLLDLIRSSWRLKRRLLILYKEHWRFETEASCEQWHKLFSWPHQCHQTPHLSWLSSENHHNFPVSKMNQVRHFIYITYLLLLSAYPGPIMVWSHQQFRDDLAIYWMCLDTMSRQMRTSGDVNLGHYCRYLAVTHQLQLSNCQLYIQLHDMLAWAIQHNNLDYEKVTIRYIWWYAIHEETDIHPSHLHPENHSEDKFWS